MDKIKVFYDYQAVCMQTYGGVSRYYYELIKEIDKNEYADATLKALFSINAYFGDYFGKKPVRYFKGLGRIIRPINEVYMRLCMRKPYDIICPTYYGGYYPKNTKAKMVLTVHDMTHEKLPQYFPASDNTIEQKKKKIYEADYIIAVSNNTKKDILEIYPDIPEDKIGVVYHGCSFKKVENGKKRDEFPNKYVLYVGARGGYKNFNTFIRAMRPILRENQELSVVCVGGGKFQTDEIQTIGEDISRYLQFDVNDEILTYAYSNAICFVYPSLYEGFGIPILEAFVCGCPVVISNTSSLPEVGGNAAEYFNPDNAEDMSTVIFEVLQNEEFREQMRQRGKVQLLKFDWKKAAYETVECYKRAMGR